MCILRLHVAAGGCTVSGVTQSCACVALGTAQLPTASHASFLVCACPRFETLSTIAVGLSWVARGGWGVGRIVQPWSPTCTHAPTHFVPRHNSSQPLQMTTCVTLLAVCAGALPYARCGPSCSHTFSQGTGTHGPSHAAPCHTRIAGRPAAVVPTPSVADHDCPFLPHQTPYAGGSHTAG